MILPKSRSFTSCGIAEKTAKSTFHLHRTPPHNHLDERGCYGYSLFSVPHTLFSLCLLFEFTLLDIRSISTDCCSSDFCSCKPQWFVLLGLTSRRPRSYGCVGWPFAPPHLLSSVVMALALVAPFRCGVVVVSSCQAPTIRTRCAQLCPSLHGLPSAPSLSPAESRT